MEFKDKIVLVADKANLNGHIYPLAELEKIVQDNKDKVIYGTIGMPKVAPVGRGFDTNPLYVLDVEKQAFANEIVGVVDNQLLVNIKVLDTPKGLLFKEMIENMKHEDIHFRTAGLCNFETANEKGTLVIKNYTLCSINYVNNPA